MKILIIRHADPDYELDGLTEDGKTEAELLKERLLKEDITEIYCSALGRAQKTIEPYLKASGKQKTVSNFLIEFDSTENHKISLPYRDTKKSCWDLLPEFVEQNPVLMDYYNWYKADFIKQSGVYEEYCKVTAFIDSVLEKNGYIRQGLNYKVKNANHNTIVFVCHFGVAGVILSHLLNVSPYSIWQNTVLLPSSVTVIRTEQRRQNIASLRASAIGDTSHIYAGKREPSFAARFCECFTDDTRHD